MWSSWPWVSTSADHVVQPMGDRVEPRQDQVDPGMVVLGEQHAAVDQQQLAVVLQHRHVPPDVAQATERNDPQRVRTPAGADSASYWRPREARLHKRHSPDSGRGNEETGHRLLGGSGGDRLTPYIGAARPDHYGRPTVIWGTPRSSGYDRRVPEALADSVRLAWPSEAAGIAAVQRRAGRPSCPPSVAEAMLGSVSAEEMTEAWHRAITRPPQASYRVLVAVEAGRVVGFASTMPSPDEDGEPGEDGQIEEFVVDPPAQRRGHGSRLLHACADTLRSDGFSRARCWVGRRGRAAAGVPGRRRLGPRRRPARDRHRRRGPPHPPGPLAHRPQPTWSRLNLLRAFHR